MKLIIVLCVLSFSGGPLFSQDWKIYYTDNQNPDQNKYGVIAFDDHFEYHPQGNYVQAYREISFRVSEEETIPDDAILNFNSHFAMSNAFWNHLSYWDWEKEEYVEVDLKEISGDPSRWTMDNYWSYPDEEGVFGLQRYGYVDNYRLVATGLKKTTILRIKIGLIFSKNYSMYDESFGRFNAPIGNWHYQKEGGTSYRLYNPNSRVEYETPEISGSGTDEIGYYIEGNLNTSITAKEKKYVNTRTFFYSEDTFRYLGDTGTYFDIMLRIFPTFRESFPRKVLFLIDHADYSSGYSKKDLIDQLRINTKVALNDQDYFNLYFTGSEITKISNTWVSANDVSVDSLFDSIEYESLSRLSNLSKLFIEGIDFVHADYDSSSRIVLISSSQQYHDADAGDALSLGIRDYMKDKIIPVTVINQLTKDVLVSQQRGRTYEGNEYFNKAISNITGGSYYNIGYYESAFRTLYKGMNLFEGNIKDLDLEILSSTGEECLLFWVKNKERLDYKSGVAGYCKSSIPEKLVITGKIGSKSSSTTIPLQLEDENSSVLSKMYLLGELHSNTLMSKSISDETNIISWATTFESEGTLNNIDDIPDLFYLADISSYPNPFNPGVNIEIKTPEPWRSSSNSIIIFNSLGQKVDVLQTTQFEGQSKFNVSWNAKRLKLSTGIYYVRVNFRGNFKTHKITYIK